MHAKDNLHRVQGRILLYSLLGRNTQQVLHSDDTRLWYRRSLCYTNEENRVYSDF